MKILICDDEVKYLDELKIYVEKYMHNKLINFHIDATTNSNDIIDNSVSYDLAFLDIQMDKVDGISLAKELKKRNNKVVVFFITSFNEFQDDAMDLRAFRFFEKPFVTERLYSGLDKAMEYIDESYLDFYAYNEKTQTRILVDDVMYIEHQNRKLFINTTNGQYSTKEKLDELYKKLPHSFFYQVHKSFLVNLHYIDKYDYTELYLNNGCRIPIASRKQSGFHKYWFAYLRRR